MKFAEHLSAHITPEWRKQYINYEEMKAMLYTAVEEAPSAENVEPEVLSRHFANFDETFFHYCDQELKKINTFYSEKLAEATRKYATLQSELKSHFDNKPKGAGRAPRRKVQELKLAFSEFYLSLILLQNYQNLNYTGFRKILKKHDKLLNAHNGAAWRAEQVECSHFYTNKDIDRLISDTEAAVTNELEGGDRQKAMKKLRVPPLGEQQSPWTTFKVGLFSGSFIVLAVAVVLSSFFHEGGTDNLKTAFRLYRGPFLLVEFIFLIGINVYGWRSSGVNHVLIFELDPRNHLSEQHLMELAAIFGVVWALSILSFIYSASLSIPPFVNPLALVIIMLVFLMNPLKVFRHEARFWFLRICGRILAAPFAAVLFADFWLADQWNSFTYAFLDLHYLVAFYLAGADWFTANNEFESTTWFIVTRACVNIVPAWTRFWQCLRRYRDSREAFPHLVNAGKYSTTFFVVLFSTLRGFYAADYTDSYANPFLYAWLICQFISSIYTYTWDVKMDWGLLSVGPGAENPLLRDEIVYSPQFYYFAIVEDLVLRFVWVPSFLLTENHIVTGDTMVSVLAPLEVFRRFIWNYFRLENEHLNNCGKFRAVRDISVAPLDSSDQALILRMMDHPDGVHNRLTKKKHPKKTKEVDRKPLIKKESIQELALELDLAKVL
ncbi:xenotropic and polytropic retrovirus receptor 1-like isoform X3 [Aricia agestis]|uniref:xenotropic and polytropic retrovirus receptor 1-like isoform X1 n=1 Tax=Aricia agestis TaxID=91739 RepID=UPI001C2084F1|nr:xenotropic and polytropic retrovirus receptor 1-like isoform X1 [Aricia agestis]XP_041985256.1 xenotropic and polytropic retrovirus receptor 1-like isoform X2 [Aricia agestis]XP_041985257.1 xenotropic and polytropic retrovirus receptor 1-like isoform X3 [Aricia agestis]